nr:putative movement protein [Inya insect-associated virus]
MEHGLPASPRSPLFHLTPRHRGSPSPRRHRRSAPPIPGPLPLVPPSRTPSIAQLIWDPSLWTRLNSSPPPLPQNSRDPPPLLALAPPCYNPLINSLHETLQVPTPPTPEPQLSPSPQLPPHRLRHCPLPRKLSEPPLHPHRVHARRHHVLYTPTNPQPLSVLPPPLFSPRLTGGSPRVSLHRSLSPPIPLPVHPSPFHPPLHPGRAPCRLLQPADFRPLLAKNTHHLQSLPPPLSLNPGVLGSLPLPAHPERTPPNPPLHPASAISPLSSPPPLIPPLPPTQHSPSTSSPSPPPPPLLLHSGRGLLPLPECTDPPQRFPDHSTPSPPPRPRARLQRPLHLHPSRPHPPSLRSRRVRPNPKQQTGTPLGHRSSLGQSPDLRPTHLRPSPAHLLPIPPIPSPESPELSENPSAPSHVLGLHPPKPRHLRPHSQRVALSTPAHPNPESSSASRPPPPSLHPSLASSPRWLSRPNTPSSNVPPPSLFVSRPPAQNLPPPLIQPLRTENQAPLSPPSSPPYFTPPTSPPCSSPQRASHPPGPARSVSNQPPPPSVPSILGAYRVPSRKLSPLPTPPAPSINPPLQPPQLSSPTSSIQQEPLPPLPPSSTSPPCGLRPYPSNPTFHLLPCPLHRKRGPKPLSQCRACSGYPSPPTPFTECSLCFRPEHDGPCPIFSECAAVSASSAFSNALRPSPPILSPTPSHAALLHYHFCGRFFDHGHFYPELFLGHPPHSRPSRSPYKPPPPPTNPKDYPIAAHLEQWLISASLSPSSPPRQPPVLPGPPPPPSPTLSPRSHPSLLPPSWNLPPTSRGKPPPPPLESPHILPPLRPHCHRSNPPL